ncbi:MoaD/ThiS family protein [Acinetobacter sp. RIT698]|jgi:molybdopterin converting factor small subunit|nr:molybdopterin converting factor small subunit [Acinetobacter guillouiae]MCW2249915.1 molybdopterin converting factor small subunit [Acinetobacter sp. BIGb0204]MRT38210.1 MoaD/ThiS family protein [Acinetobacter sp. RIT698]NII39019.1 molybdopterin converting factor small subunit [Acinetobacter sp. BIGb0196]
MSDQFTIPNTPDSANIANQFKDIQQHMTVKIECFGAIERLLPTDLTLQCESEMRISDVLDYVVRAYPHAGNMLERCACAIGEEIIPRQTLLTADSTVVLLSPVAGG